MRQLVNMKKRKEPNLLPWDESNPNHWSRYIQQYQEEYNKLKGYIWVMRDSKLGVASYDWDLINEYVNKCTLIENWCERNGITIKKHPYRDPTTYTHYKKGGEEVEHISIRWEFIPPQDTKKEETPTIPQSPDEQIDLNPLQLGELNKTEQVEYYVLKARKDTAEDAHIKWKIKFFEDYSRTIYAYLNRIRKKFKKENPTEQFNINGMSWYNKD